MTDLDIIYSWYDPELPSDRIDSAGRWTACRVGSEDTEALFDFLEIDLEYKLDNVEACIALLKQSQAGEADLCEVWAGDDGAVFYGNGHVLIASDVDDEDRVLMTDDQFLIVLQQVRRSMNHVDYRNRNANPFGGFTVDIVATGAGSLDEYYTRGGVTPIMLDD